MYVDIYKYIIWPLADRQKHLDLAEDCLCIGGNSREFRGALAHYLRTTIPKGMKIHLCHACNNGECSNPKHLYWGSPGENVQDTIRAGRWPKKREIKDKRKLVARAYKNHEKMRIACTGSIWVNNGSMDLRVSKDAIPEGFVRGRLWKGTIMNKLHLAQQDRAFTS